MASLSRCIVGTFVLIGGLLIAAACAPAAAPTPTTAPAKPTATAVPAAKPSPTAATKQTEATPAASKPAATAAAKPAASADWKARWDSVVAAAKREGKVVVAGGTGDARRAAAMEFQKAYPDITLEYTGMSGSEIAPRILAERGAGQYLWDVYQGGATTMITSLMPNGVLDPVKPALILPEVLDDSKWMGGLDAAWADKARQYVFGYEAGFVPTTLVNRSVVPESELNSIKQLADPKWKGKIVTADPRTAGSSGTQVTLMRMQEGEAWARQFLDNLVMIPDERRVVESAIRGTYPILVNPGEPAFRQFRIPEFEQVLANIKPVTLDEVGGAGVHSASNNFGLFNKAPHPNAAAVFLNWGLSREGQKAYVENLAFDSGRVDVESGRLYKPNPKVNYVNMAREEMIAEIAATHELAKEFIK